MLSQRAKDLRSKIMQSEYFGRNEVEFGSERKSSLNYIICQMIIGLGVKLWLCSFEAGFKELNLELSKSGDLVQ
jgi:hypothetical protein